MATKFGYDLANTICILHSQGLNRIEISKKVKIDRKSIYRWLKKGETDKRGVYKKFYDNWQKADEEYYKINPPKNSYNRKYARETFKGYNKFKKAVLKRDKVCQCCGFDDDLEVHHIDGVKDNPELATDVNNGVVLCKYCHLKYHKIYSRYDVNKCDFEEFMNRFGIW